MARITTADLQSKIEIVKVIAERAGLKNLTYSGGTYDGLHLRQENNTVWLSATLNDGSSGVDNVGGARGKQAVADYLSGMIAVLESVDRFNK